jgi:hypothetical protein
MIPIASSTSGSGQLAGTHSSLRVKQHAVASACRRRVSGPVAPSIGIGGLRAGPADSDKEAAPRWARVRRSERYRRGVSTRRSLVATVQITHDVLDLLAKPLSRLVGITHQRARALTRREKPSDDLAAESCPSLPSPGSCHRLRLVLAKDRSLHRSPPVEQIAQVGMKGGVCAAASMTVAMDEEQASRVTPAWLPQIAHCDSEPTAGNHARWSSNSVVIIGPNGSSEDHRLRATRACIGLLRGYMPLLLMRNRHFVTRATKRCPG